MFGKIITALAVAGTLLWGAVGIAWADDDNTVGPAGGMSAQDWAAFNPPSSAADNTIGDAGSMSPQDWAAFNPAGKHGDPGDGHHHGRDNGPRHDRGYDYNYLNTPGYRYRSDNSQLRFLCMLDPVYPPCLA